MFKKTLFFEFAYDCLVLLVKVKIFKVVWYVICETYRILKQRKKLLNKRKKKQPFTNTRFTLKKKQFKINILVFKKNWYILS